MESVSASKKGKAIITTMNFDLNFAFLSEYHIVMCGVVYWKQQFYQSSSQFK